MVDAISRPLPPGLDRWPPTQDDLPYEDDKKVASYKHDLQAEMLTEPLRREWAPRQNGHVFIGSDMFVYFRPDQHEQFGFRGPDLLVALGVPPRTRKSWVIWEEGKAPDVVVELRSDSTAQTDRAAKFAIYRDQMRVPVYVLFHPLTGEFAAYSLVGSVYQPLQPDQRGGVYVSELDLWLLPWQGAYGNESEPWIRWAYPDGTLIPLPQEIAANAEQVVEMARRREEAARQRAERERQRAEQERQRAEAEQERARELEAALARYRERFGTIDE